MFAFGGAGPVHAFGVGAALGTTTVIVPAAAGVMSSVGVLAAPLATDGVRSRVEPVDDDTLTRMEPLFAELEQEGDAVLSSSGASEITHERSIDMRYVGQGFEVTVPVEPGEDLKSAFEAAYVRSHGRKGPDVPIEAISWRVLTRGPDPDLRLDRGARPATARRRRARATCGSTTPTSPPRSTTATGWARARRSTARRSSRSASPPPSSARARPPAWPRTAACIIETVAT